MRWPSLLSTKRLGREQPRPADEQRSPFEIDVDRFVFCSAFRRLQAKMQVHGPMLDKGDSPSTVRNRLTHSLEASRVGRSLGQLAGRYLAGRGLLSAQAPADIGHLVSGAALCHDIGQTPFSHEAEQAISLWWSRSALAQAILAGLPTAYAHELTSYNGNAFGFRLLTRLEGWHENGGLQLTSATLATFSKYPWSGGIAPAQRPKPDKYGIFSSELDLFAEVASETGLIEQAAGQWCRHPLAYLTEAADDICYLVVDVEDAVVMGALTVAEGEALLAPLAAIEATVYDQLEGPARRLTYLRSRAISTLISEASEIWCGAHDRLLDGIELPPLLDAIPHRQEIETIARVSRERIYRGSGRAETALIANRTIAVLLDGFADVLLRREASARDMDLSIPDQAVLSILGRDQPQDRPVSRLRGEWVATMMDHIARLTDLDAMREARILAG